MHGSKINTLAKLAIVVTLVLVVSGASLQPALATLADLGSEYSVHGLNPVNFDATATLDGASSLVANGMLQVTEVITPDATGEWIEIVISTPNGGPLASNLHGNWRFSFDALKFTQPVFYDNLFFYWSWNGQAVGNITPLGTLSGTISVNPNPINSALGQVFLGVPHPPGGPTQTHLAGVFFVESNLSTMSIDLNSANDFHLAIHVFPVDDDGDGVPANSDLCPDTAPGDPVDAAGCADAQVDEDGDGVCDPNAASNGPSACEGTDICPQTAIPESVPTVRLGTNRWALVNNDFEFDTKAPRGKGPGRSYSTPDTAGCSCEQIIAEQGLGKGHTKHGCSISAMDDWVLLVTP